MQRFDRQTKQYQYTTLSIQRKTNIKKKENGFIAMFQSVRPNYKADISKQ